MSAAIDSIPKTYSAQKKKFEELKATEEDALRLQIATLENKFSEAQKKLTNEEHQLRLQSQKATEECRARYQAAANRLLEDQKLLKQRYEAEIAPTNASIDAAGRIARQKLWFRERIARKLAAHGLLSFRHYALRAFGF